MPSGVNPIPKPPRTFTEKIEDIPVESGQAAENSEAVPEEVASTESAKPKERTGLSKKLARIFGQLKRFVNGTNFNKVPAKFINSIKSEASLLADTKSGEKADPVFTMIHERLSDWNNKVDQLATMKVDESG